MAIQFIDKKHAGTDASPSALTDSAANRQIVRNPPNAAGIAFDDSANKLVYNGADAIHAVVSEDDTQTLTNKTLTAPAITTPTMTFTASAATATGATGSTATTLTSAYPALVTCTGTSGMGVAFATGAAVAGALYFIKNKTTGDLNVYAVGGTINGTTGTTAYAISATGSLGAAFMCVTAGAWEVIPLAT